MLSEVRQLKLASTDPQGTAKTPDHLKYREIINSQQSKLENINQSKLPIKQKIDKMDLEKFLEDQLGISRYGYTPIIDEYTYENSEINENTGIVVMTPLDYNNMITAPSIQSATEILRSYANCGAIVIEVTKFLRDHGYQSFGHHPMGDEDQYHHLLFPPHAVEAGLGEKGRTGLFIDYKLGPAVRLGMITTTIDLPFKGPQKKGITEFCHRCRYCVRHCPPKAIPSERYNEHLEQGEHFDFKIDARRCFQYFKKHNACGKCIVNCVLANEDLKDTKRYMDRINSWFKKWVKSGAYEELYATTDVNNP